MSIEVKRGLTNIEWGNKVQYYTKLHLKIAKRISDDIVPQRTIKMITRFYWSQEIDRSQRN